MGYEDLQRHRICIYPLDHCPSVVFASITAKKVCCDPFFLLSCVLQKCCCFPFFVLLCLCTLLLQSWGCVDKVYSSDCIPNQWVQKFLDHNLVILVFVEISRWK